MLHEGRALKKLTTYQQDKVNINLIKKKYQKFINKKQEIALGKHKADGIKQYFEVNDKIKLKNINL